ncbi:MAG: hypothetical protein QNJ05_03850 [Woeseiaceae bacterium]|nr:hypothetical protein [Woeseiaceae bacterium]
MKYLKLLVALTLLPVAAVADINIQGVGGVSNWYFQADFEKMRNTEAGKPLYAWMQEEVFDELNRESGIELDKDLEQLIAQSDGNDGVIVVMNGTVRQETRDQIMAIAAIQNIDLAPRKAGRKQYFFIEGDPDSNQGDENPFEDGAFLSFDVKDKVILTSSESQMKSLLDNGGKLKKRNSRAMIMFSAENTLMEAGIETKPDASEDWDSNIMKNTEEAALLIADAKGKLGVEAQLVSKEPEMAESLASIVRGLISLQVFNEELDPELATLLKETRVDVKDRVLSISIALDPNVVVDSLN